MGKKNIHGKVRVISVSEAKLKGDARKKADKLRRHLFLYGGV